MELIYLCCNGDDSIYRIEIGSFKVRDIIKVENSGIRVGPNNISLWGNKLITSNIFSDGISIYDVDNETFEEDYYIGRSCIESKVLNEHAYILSRDSNSLVKFNMINRKIEQVIPCGNCPSSLNINVKRKKIAVTNLGDNSIEIIDYYEEHKISNIKLSGSPLNSVITSDENYLIVCEANYNYDSRGTLSLVSFENHEIVDRVTVGKMPNNIFYDEQFYYVSNFADGTVSIIDKESFKEVGRLTVGGMPSNIMKIKNYIYVSDFYNNKLIRIECNGLEIKTLLVGKNPTGMLYLIE